MGKIKEELVTFGKAELTASCASVVDFGLAFFLSDIIGIYYGLANALGVISGGITNCILNYRYVFGDSKSKKKSVAWRYFIIWGISWMLNSGGTIALTEFLNAGRYDLVLDERSHLCSDDWFCDGKLCPCPCRGFGY